MSKKFLALFSVPNYQGGMSYLGNAISLFGLLVLLTIAWILSEDKGKINYRTILSGIGIQFLLGALLLWSTPGLALFEVANLAILKLVQFSNSGAQMVFGEKFSDHFFAFSVLPSIIFFSSLMAILFHLRIMQKVVGVYSWVMFRIMKVSGAEATAASSRVFVGGIEAAFTIQPYVSRMTRSEIMALSTAGMATIAGGVMAAYVGLGMNGGHLLSAQLMSAVSSLIIAKIMVPETGEPFTLGRKDVVNVVQNQEAYSHERLRRESPRAYFKSGFLPPACVEKILKSSSTAVYTSVLKYFQPRQKSKSLLSKQALSKEENIFDAACKGAIDGMKVAAIVASVLIAFVALTSLVNTLLGFAPAFYGQALSIERILGWCFRPIVFLTGAPWVDSAALGTLLGKKIFLNEFLAYLDLRALKDQISPRSFILATYFLCGFGNLSALAMQIGGLGSLFPEKKGLFAELGFKSMVAGTLATLTSACIAGMLL